MAIKAKVSQSKTVEKRLTMQQKADKLFKEIEKARAEHKIGNFVRGNVEEIIKHTRSLLLAYSAL